MTGERPLFSWVLLPYCASSSVILLLLRSPLLLLLTPASSPPFSCLPLNAFLLLLSLRFLSSSSSFVFFFCSSSSYLSSLPDSCVPLYSPHLILLYPASCPTLLYLSLTCMPRPSLPCPATPASLHLFICSRPDTSTALANHRHPVAQTPHAQQATPPICPLLPPADHSLLPLSTAPNMYTCPQYHRPLIERNT